MLDAKVIEKLIAADGNRWQKYGKDRIYFDADAIVDMDTVSRRTAAILRSGKTYIDVETGAIYSDCGITRDALTALVDSIAAEIKAEAEAAEVSEVEQDAEETAEATENAETVAAPAAPAPRPRPRRRAGAAAYHERMTKEMPARIAEYMEMARNSDKPVKYPVF